MKHKTKINKQTEYRKKKEKIKQEKHSTQPKKRKDPYFDSKIYIRQKNKPILIAFGKGNGNLTMQVSVACLHTFFYH